MNCHQPPDLILLTDFDGNYAEYEEAVYEAFLSSLDTAINNGIEYGGLRIAHKKHPLLKNKSATFWHITSDGDIENEREPDLRRYERIKWPAHILQICVENCPDLLVWENKRARKCRVLLWCQKEEYLIVLERRNGFFLFWTAYPVTYNHTKRKLQREYDEYKAKAASS